VANTQKLQLPLLYSNQAQKDVTINQALTQLDALVQASVISRTLTTPPASPNNEDMYIVPANAAGIWSGQTNNLAVYMTSLGTWMFLPPQPGWTVWSQADNALYTYTGSNGWATEFGVLQPLNGALTALSALTPAQAASLVTIGLLTPANNTILVGNGSSWSAKTIAQTNTVAMAMIFG